MTNPEMAGTECVLSSSNAGSGRFNQLETVGRDCTKDELLRKSCIKKCLELELISLKTASDASIDPMSGPVSEIEISSIDWERAYEYKDNHRDFNNFVFVATKCAHVLRTAKVGLWGVSHKKQPTFVASGVPIFMYFVSKEDAQRWADWEGEQVVPCRPTRTDARQRISAVSL